MIWCTYKKWKNRHLVKIVSTYRLQLYGFQLQQKNEFGFVENQLCVNCFTLFLVYFLNFIIVFLTSQNVQLDPIFYYEPPSKSKYFLYFSVYRQTDTHTHTRTHTHISLAERIVFFIRFFIKHYVFTIFYYYYCCHCV